MRMKGPEENGRVRQAGAERMLASDIPELLLLERKSFGSMAWSETDFRHALENTLDIPLVLREESGAAYAYAVLRILGEEAEIENICVSVRHRRKGAGEALLTEMLALSRERACSRVYLEVRAGNAAARALYEKLGFRKQYLRRGYYRDPVEDGVVMMLEIGNGEK